MPITGNKAQPCDRSVIISGGVDASNNHARYKDNVIAKFNKMKQMGFTDAQIQVFYDDGAAINVGVTNVMDDKATKQKIKDHFTALAADMTGSCTLTLFVTDHGTGYNAEQGYHGARPALVGNGVDERHAVPENTFKIDARAKAYRVERPTSCSTERRTSPPRTTTARSGSTSACDGNWVFLGTNNNGDAIISETEASGEDFNGDGDGTDADFGISVAATWRPASARYQYRTNEWDTDGDGVDDVRVRHDGTRFVIERLDGGTWKEMGRDTNGDFIIDATDGGVDWNLDGNKNGQVGFHEGINLWGKEVLWDDDFADLLKPLADKGIHIVVEMVSCFSGGIVPQL